MNRTAGRQSSTRSAIRGVCAALVALAIGAGVGFGQSDRPDPRTQGDSPPLGTQVGPLGAPAEAAAPTLGTPVPAPLRAPVGAPTPGIPATPTLGVPTTPTLGAPVPAARPLDATTAAPSATTVLRRSPEIVAPEVVGFDATRFARVDSIIDHALREGASPGAALVVGRHGRLVRAHGYGYTDWGPFAPVVTDSTLYDMASLTKAMGTATVAIQLAGEGRLFLDAPIHRYLPDWPGYGMHGRITVRHLLGHTSGLPIGADLWPGWRPRSEIIASLGLLRVRTTPGTRREYSDVGMILLGAVLEQVSGSRLDDLLEMRVFRPLAMHDTRFNPLTAHGEYGGFALAQIAPTELDRFIRKTLVHGVVHDLNAWAMDGVAGHAGLFSSARDMAVFGQAMLDAAHGRDNPLFAAGVFMDWLQRESIRDRALGWDTPNGLRSSAGLYFTKSSFGHTGFTGTSLWVDPEREVFVVLLTNRLNPSALNQRHVQLRRDVHDYVQLAIADMSVQARE